MLLAKEDVSAWGTLLGIFLVAVVQQFSMRRNRNNARTLREQLNETDEKKDKKLDAIHTLVNSGMGKQLELAMNLSRRIAELTKDPGDVLVAQRAASDFSDYRNREAKTVPPSPPSPSTNLP